MPLRLVGTAEIRRMLGGVSKQRAYEITMRKTFPEPVAELEQGRVWLTEDVEKWIAKYRQQVDD